MKGTPAFQFYPQDFLSDANVTMMSLDQVGAYWFLCCHEWNEDGLPTDGSELASLSRAGEKWPNICSLIMRCFVEKDGKYFHPRNQKERDKQKRNRIKRSKAGKASGVSRRKKIYDKGLRGEHTDVQNLNENEHADVNEQDYVQTKTNSSTSSSTSLKEINKENIIDDEPPPRPDDPEPSAQVQNSMVRICGGILPSQLMAALRAHGAERVQAAFDATEKTKPGQTVSWNYVAAILLNWGRNGMPTEDTGKKTGGANASGRDIGADGSRESTTVPVFYRQDAGE